MSRDVSRAKVLAKHWISDRLLVSARASLGLCLYPDMSLGSGSEPIIGFPSNGERFQLRAA